MNFKTNENVPRLKGKSEINVQWVSAYRYIHFVNFLKFSFIKHSN